MTVRRIPTKRGDMTQFVKVDLDGKAYTYKWTGSVPLEPGDRVVVPANVVTDTETVRRVLRVLDKPDYEVAKIVEILSKVESISRPEPHDWDDLIGDLSDGEDINHQQALDEFDAFENYVAEQAHAARLQRWDGVDPSADDLPEDAFRMMHKRHVDALPDEQLGDPSATYESPDAYGERG